MFSKIILNDQSFFFSFFMREAQGPKEIERTTAMDAKEPEFPCVFSEDELVEMHARANLVLKLPPIPNSQACECGRRGVDFGCRYAGSTQRNFAPNFQHPKTHLLFKYLLHQAKLFHEATESSRDTAWAEFWTINRWLSALPHLNARRVPPPTLLALFQRANDSLNGGELMPS